MTADAVIGLTKPFVKDRADAVIGPTNPFVKDGADAVIGPTRGGIHFINRLKPLQFTLGILGTLVR